MVIKAFSILNILQLLVCDLAKLSVMESNIILHFLFQVDYKYHRGYSPQCIVIFSLDNI